VGGEAGNASAAVPDCEQPERLVAAFEATQALLDVEGALLAVHDVSDGGLAVAVLEMAFAGNCGLDVTLPGDAAAPLPALFAEEVGLVLEVPAGREAEVLAAYAARGVFAAVLGATLEAPAVTISVGVATCRCEDEGFVSVARVRYFCHEEHAFRGF
jgi:phosphoribosylformylglycinamidine synthase